VALIAFLGLIPGIVYASTLFDSWHNRRQVQRKRGKR
jgi:hypothetical protein